MNKEMRNILKLLSSENIDDKILGTILLGRKGKSNIKCLFDTRSAVGYYRRIGGVNILPVRIIYINDCRFWLGGSSLNLLFDDYFIENDKNHVPEYEILNYE